MALVRLVRDDGVAVGSWAVVELHDGDDVADVAALCLLLQQVRVSNITALACVLLLILGTQAEDALKTTTQFFVVCFVSVTVMWRMGAF